MNDRPSKQQPLNLYAGPFTSLRQINDLAEAAEAEADTAFMARLMTLCSLPRSNPGDRLQYVRRNGPFSLFMTATGDEKLPYGNLPRLLLAWICTEAVRTQKRELVLGKSLSEFMKKLGLPTTGASRTRLRNQMKRLFYSYVRLIYQEGKVEASVGQPLATKTSFWWDPKTPDQPSLWDSKVEIDEQLFNEIIAHPVPLDMNILKALRRSALGLDLYLWLTYRTFSLKKPIRLEWKRLYRQFGVDPSQANNKRLVDAFRTDCLRELTKIKTAWHGLNYSTAKGVLILSPSKPAIPSQT